MVEVGERRRLLLRWWVSGSSGNSFRLFVSHLSLCGELLLHFEGNC